MRALLLACALIAAPAWAASDFAYTQKVGAGETAMTAIDTRPLAECKRASLPGARCLPVADFLGPRKQLPAERDLLWLFGTAGLDGNESVLVVGDNAAARDFVGGLLYLSGQRMVRILNVPLTPLLAGRADAAPGQERGVVRSAIWTAPMRDHLWIVHPREVSAAGNDILAPDAHAAIVRFTRRLASGGQPVRVGWALSSGSSSR